MQHLLGNTDGLRFKMGKWVGVFIHLETDGLAAGGRLSWRLRCISCLSAVGRIFGSEDIKHF